jgi:hypothetical protein
MQVSVGQIANCEMDGGAPLNINGLRNTLRQCSKQGVYARYASLMERNDIITAAHSDNQTPNQPIRKSHVV